MFSFLWEGGYSVAFLQETRTTPDDTTTWRLEWGDRVFFSHLSATSCRVATLFSPSLQPEILEDIDTVPGRLLRVWDRVARTIVNFVNVYGPVLEPDAADFFRQAADYIGPLSPCERLVLGGDFNVTLREKDRSHR